MAKIMMDGEPLEVGDRVYCLVRGEGKVVEIVNGDFPILCRFGTFSDGYTPDFNFSRHNKSRTLYWQKPKILPPPKIKPKKKIKVWDWFVEEYNGDTLKLIGITSPVCDYKTIQKIEGTEREIEVEE